MSPFERQQQALNLGGGVCVSKANAAGGRDRFWLPALFARGAGLWGVVGGGCFQGVVGGRCLEGVVGGGCL